MNVKQGPLQKGLKLHPLHDSGVRLGGFSDCFTAVVKYAGLPDGFATLHVMLTLCLSTM